MSNIKVSDLRTERNIKRNYTKNLFALKSDISKKDKTIIKLENQIDTFRSSNEFLDKSNKFFYNNYCKIYKDFEEISEAYSKLKNEKEILDKNYKELIGEFVEKESKNEIED
jgi:CII-binding regulator of phage lambda lysogenization HflD